jgi:WD40 repeat protein
MTIAVGEPVLTNARVYHAHDSWVACVAFSPDSNIIASGGGSDDSLRGHGELKLFEAGTGKLMRTFRDYETTVRAAAFAADGKSIAAGGYPVIVWNLPAGTKRLKIKPPASLLSLAYLAAQDQLVTTSMGKRDAAVWETKRGRRLTTLSDNLAPEAGNTWSLSVPKAGKLLATGGHKRRAIVWNCSNWTVIRTVASPDETRVVCLNPEGTVLYTEGDSRNPGKLWNVRDGTLSRSDAVEHA